MLNYHMYVLLKSSLFDVTTCSKEGGKSCSIECLLWVSLAKSWYDDWGRASIELGSKELLAIIAIDKFDFEEVVLEIEFLLVFEAWYSKPGIKLVWFWCPYW